jgi:hypothetical protein
VVAAAVANAVVMVAMALRAAASTRGRTPPM